jgi:hypothetical protein
MLTNTKKLFLQVKWGHWSQEITLDEDLEMTFHFFFQQLQICELPFQA